MGGHSPEPEHTKVCISTGPDAGSGTAQILNQIFWPTVQEVSGCLHPAEVLTRTPSMKHLLCAGFCLEWDCAEKQTPLSLPSLR